MAKGTEITTHIEQRDICQRFGAEFTPPEPDQKVGIALNTLTSDPLHAVRISSGNGTCGWYIYSGEHSTDPDFYQSLHVAHLNEYCPSIVPYLALPSGWRVMLAPDYEDVWFDGGLLATPTTSV